jgi:hypothetical protein
VAVGDGERQAAQGKGEIPAELFELGFGQETEEGIFGIGEDAGEGWRGFAGCACGDSFEDVGGALDDAGVVVPEEFDETGGETGLRFNEGDGLRDLAERESVFALSENIAEIDAGGHRWRATRTYRYQRTQMFRTG